MTTQLPSSIEAFIWLHHGLRIRSRQFWFEIFDVHQLDEVQMDSLMALLRLIRTQFDEILTLTDIMMRDLKPDLSPNLIEIEADLFLDSIMTNYDENAFFRAYSLLCELARHNIDTKKNLQKFTDSSKINSKIKDLQQLITQTITKIINKDPSLPQFIAKNKSFSVNFINYLTLVTEKSLNDFSPRKLDFKYQNPETLLPFHSLMHNSIFSLIKLYPRTPDDLKLFIETHHGLCIESERIWNTISTLQLNLIQIDALYYLLAKIYMDIENLIITTQIEISKYDSPLDKSTYRTTACWFIRYQTFYANANAYETFREIMHAKKLTDYTRNHISLIRKTIQDFQKTISLFIRELTTVSSPERVVWQIWKSNYIEQNRTWQIDIRAQSAIDTYHKILDERGNLAFIPIKPNSEDIEPAILRNFVEQITGLTPPTTVSAPNTNFVSTPIVLTPEPSTMVVIPDIDVAVSETVKQYWKFDRKVADEKLREGNYRLVHDTLIKGKYHNVIDCFLEHEIIKRREDFVSELAKIMSDNSTDVYLPKYKCTLREFFNMRQLELQNYYASRALRELEIWDYDSFYLQLIQTGELPSFGYDLEFVLNVMSRKYGISITLYSDQTQVIINNSNDSTFHVPSMKLYAQGPRCFNMIFKNEKTFKKIGSQSEIDISEKQDRDVDDYLHDNDFYDMDISDDSDEIQDYEDYDLDILDCSDYEY